MNAVSLEPEAGHTLRRGALTVRVAVDTGQLERVYGPRFDRTARVSSTRFRGQEFLDPRGLVDEFGITGLGVLGYDAALPGGEFIKIGVGTLLRPDDKPYSFIPHYPVLEHYPVDVACTPEFVTVRQTSRSRTGYGYHYEKTFTLADEGRLEIRYRLENAGDRPFAFEQYNHNFLRFADEPVDPRYRVVPSFPIEVPPPPPWSWDGESVRLTQEAPERGGTAFHLPISAPSREVQVMVHHANGQSLRLTGDFAPARAALWAIRATLSPEVFFRATVAPAASVTWARGYAFSAP